MRDRTIIAELSECLEQLRWGLSGARAGGLLDWARALREIPENAPVKAECEPSRVGDSEAMPTTHGGHKRPGPTLQNYAECRERARAARDTPGIAARENAPLSPVTHTVEETLSEIEEALSGCRGCRLHSGRRNLVFGEGSMRSGVVFVGEGPGFEEDQQGRPFVGRAGKLLDKMILAMGFDRTDTYICNVVKCRPPENRTPQADEIEACSPFLVRQIRALKPKVICALGASAAQTLVGHSSPISRLRGKLHHWRGIPLVCTYHPAYLLRTPAQKGPTWQDLKKIMEVLNSGA